MHVHRTTGQNGLPKLVLSHDSGSTAEIYLHGAHITSWKPAGGAEALFLSRAAQFQSDKSIRGGIPVVFPQFADLGPLPKHGFARLQNWAWIEQDESASRAVLRLDESEATRATWPPAFRAELAVELGDRDLSLTLSIENTDARPFDFAAALHTYLRVADVRRVAVEGLQGVRYRDRAEQELRLDEAPRLTIAGEVDRLYLNAPRTVQVEDRAGNRTFRVESKNFADAVVWNPWMEIAASLPDMEDDEYLEMVCVEAAQVGEPVELAPGETWQGTQQIEVAA